MANMFPLPGDPRPAPAMPQFGMAPRPAPSMAPRVTQSMGPAPFGMAPRPAPPMAPMAAPRMAPMAAPPMAPKVAPPVAPINPPFSLDPVAAPSMPPTMPPLAVSNTSITNTSSQVNVQRSTVSTNISTSDLPPAFKKSLARREKRIPDKPLEALQNLGIQLAKNPSSVSTKKDDPFRDFSSGMTRTGSGMKDMMLMWCQCRTRDYKGVKIDNFGSSWSDGLAFCALIHHFYPDAFDYDKLTAENRRQNFELAFKTADERAGIYPLLEVDDMVSMTKPDWRSVFAYIQSLYQNLKDK